MNLNMLTEHVEVHSYVCISKYLVYTLPVWYTFRTYIPWDTTNIVGHNASQFMGLKFVTELI